MMWLGMSVRERDAMVAKKVMGFTVEELEGDLVQKETSSYLPNYTTDISDAWQVLEQFYSHTLTFRNLEKSDYHECWVVDYSGEGEAVESYGKSDTAPMAICLAALKAKGVEL